MYDTLYSEVNAALDKSLTSVELKLGHDSCKHKCPYINIDSNSTFDSDSDYNTDSGSDSDSSSDSDLNKEQPPRKKID